MIPESKLLVPIMYNEGFMHPLGVLEQMQAELGVNKREFEELLNNDHRAEAIRYKRTVQNNKTKYRNTLRLMIAASLQTMLQELDPGLRYTVRSVFNVTNLKGEYQTHQALPKFMMSAEVNVYEMATRIMHELENPVQYSGTAGSETFLSKDPSAVVTSLILRVQPYRINDPSKPAFGVEISSAEAKYLRTGLEPDFKVEFMYKLESDERVRQILQYD
jgi:hypothetical protein